MRLGKTLLCVNFGYNAVCCTVTLPVICNYETGFEARMVRSHEAKRSGLFGFTRSDRSASEAKRSGPFGFMRLDHLASEAKWSGPLCFMRPDRSASEAKRSGLFGLMRPDRPASKPVSQLHMTVTVITVMLPYLQ